jgi:hypothetical protein
MAPPPDQQKNPDQSVVSECLPNFTTMMITVAFHPSPVAAGQVAVRRY